MKPRKSPQDIRNFGDALIRTGDLDPVYIAVWGARLPRPQLYRLLLAYWCFYHLGVAAWMSEQAPPSYWWLMKIAAQNEISPISWNLPGERWPRGTERRHFRGDACVKAIEFFSQRPPEEWVHDLTFFQTDHGVMNKVQEWPLFGPWIAFKVADMMERVAGVPLKFDYNIGLLYKEPRAALDLLAQDTSLITTDRTPEGLYANVSAYFQSRKAPPGDDRLCGPQEVETILCKWKSMKGGHYWVGKDITEVRHALPGWGETASRLTPPDEV